VPPAVKDTENPSTQLIPPMRIKQEKSKAILEGLTLQDFDKIAANARSLRLSSTEAGSPQESILALASQANQCHFSAA